MKDSILFLFVFLIFTFSKCIKSKCQNNYAFDIPFSHTIVTDTINIGDTIWISSEFGITLADKTSGEICEFNNVNFQSHLVFAEMSGHKSKLINEKFHLVNEIGKANLNFFNKDTTLTLGIGSSYEILYSFTNKYKLKLGFIPSESGFYNCGLGSPIDDYENENIKKKCNGSIEFSYAMNKKDTSINNFHMLSQTFVPSYKNMSASEFQRYGSFCFIVK